MHSFIFWKKVMKSCLFVAVCLPMMLCWLVVRAHMFISMFIYIHMFTLCGGFPL